MRYRRRKSCVSASKNIGRKRERDLEFDWADETLHAEYGRRWLNVLLGPPGEDPDFWPSAPRRRTGPESGPPPTRSWQRPHAARPNRAR